MVLNAADRAAFGAAKDDHLAEMALITLRGPAGLILAALSAE
ncbi:hypothetical protein [Kushneria aurantia]|uniref:Uncharacterized protein n=1 Tax=Kushneria aurantia TaxID=504092 RepID=A0ABV6G475_9GAMM|nr:hypothetical protein [Kushneria aurantia]